jgi:hypothetical protein
MDYTEAITAQVHQALKLMGSCERPASKGGMTEALERAGAHPYLRAFIGSWGDTLEDAEILDALKDWNAGIFKMNTIASTCDVPRPKVRLRRVK